MPSIKTPAGIDPRGPRFGAAITAALLAVILVTGPTSPVALFLLILQTLAFAAGSLIGVHAQPWGLIFKHLLRPRLAAPTELEDPRPPRFAQSVGLGFAVIALLGFLAGLHLVFYIAVAFALVAALLNAVFNFCLGCEMYLLGRRVLAKPRTVD